MKLTLLALLVLCSACAFGQAAVSVSSQPYVLQIPEHPQHAEVTPMACEHPLVGGSSDNYTYAKGERPLWEFGPVSKPVPLGDVARAFRKEKLAARKAEKVFEKQGS